MAMSPNIRVLRVNWRLRSACVLPVVTMLAVLLLSCADEDSGTDSTAAPSAPTDGTTPRAGATAAGTQARPTPRPGEGPRTGGEIGRAATSSEIASVDIDVTPGGSGLPPGRGSVSQGASVYARRCAGCHGPNAVEAPVGPRLVSEPGPWRPGMPVTIGTYWPYAETLFDYTRRAMPFDSPGSLSNDEVYAVVAWLLNQNRIIGGDAEMNAQTLPQVEMPNRNNFYACWPQECRPEFQ